MEFGYLLESLNLLIVLSILVGYTVIIFSLLIDFCPYILLLLIRGLQIGKNKDHVLYHFQMLVVIFLRLEIISSLLENLKHVPPLLILGIDEELLRVIFNVVSLLVDSFAAEAFNLLHCLRKEIVDTLGAQSVVAVFAEVEILVRLALWTLILEHFKLTF